MPPLRMVPNLDRHSSPEMGKVGWLRCIRNTSRPGWIFRIPVRRSTNDPEPHTREAVPPAEREGTTCRGASWVCCSGCSPELAESPEPVEWAEGSGGLGDESPPRPNGSWRGGRCKGAFARIRTLNRRKRSTLNAQRSIGNRKWALGNEAGSWRGGRCQNVSNRRMSTTPSGRRSGGVASCRRIPGTNWGECWQHSPQFILLLHQLLTR